jgi:phosphoglycolate phosphatase-like HAD superfamily hydrolase
MDMGFERKPNPQAFKYLIEKHQISKAQALSVGDRHLDMKAGHNAGMSGCLILDAFNSDFVSEADYVISNRMSVLDILVNGV